MDKTMKDPISRTSLYTGVTTDRELKVFTVRLITSTLSEDNIRSYTVTISTSWMSRTVTGLDIKAPLVSKLSIRLNSSLEELKLGNLVGVLGSLIMNILMVCVRL